ncbi:MAG: HAMP domain-containing sensor histidine kinase [Gammaproteobacteria bacterium]
MRLSRLNSLLGRTVLVVFSAFFLFSVFAILATGFYLLRPLQERAAEDLSALIVLSAQVWVELPPWTRLDYEAALGREHALQVADASVDLPRLEPEDRYLRLIARSLSEKTRKRVALKTNDENPDWIWADIDLGSKVVRIGFSRERLQALIIFLTTLLLVLHITRPLARLTHAVQQISKTGGYEPLEEKGPRELAILAHRINSAEREIQTLLDNRTTLLAGISHDLRTPLTRMQLELALLPADTPEEQVRSLDNEIDIMNRLVSQTLELARGLGKHEQPDTQLADFLARFVDEHALTDEPVTLEMGTGCTFMIPSHPLRRILENLVGNALRYSDGRPVTLCAECHESSAILRVRDQGPGIPPAFREKVFTPFFRLENSRNPHTGGSGLGLAIARQLCDFYGWDIRLGDSPDGGLEVILRITPTMAGSQSDATETG